MVDNFKLVESAKKDLEAAKLLYSEDLFSQSVFFTQQSIEKVSKYLALDSDSIKFEELQRKIGHNAIEAFKIVIDDKNEMLTHILDLRKNDKSVTPNFLNLDQMPSDINATISFIKSYNLENLGESDLGQIKKSIEEIGSSLNEKYFDKAEMIKMEISQFAEFLHKNHLLTLDQKNQLVSDVGRNDTLKDYLNSFLKDFIVCFPDYIAAILKVFLVAMVFTKHAVSSRYPDARKGFNPEEFYNTNNPLVKEIPFFHKAIDDSIKSIGRYYLTINLKRSSQ